jgi:hypothetical protein
MEKFTCPESGISRLGKTGLQGFDIRVIHKVVGTLVTTGGRGELAGENGSPTWSAKDSRGVGIGKIDSALGKLIDIGSDCTGSLSQTANPIIHVVHSKKENIGPLGSTDRLAKYRKERGQDYKQFH